MNRTGIVQDPIYMEHVMDPGHPERPERLKVIYEMLEEEEEKDLQLIKVKPRLAIREELETIHSSAYIDRVASTAGKLHFRLDPDTSTSARSYEAALLAAGGLCELIRAVL
jgi:acetoin utilization deacetylase AcuC-like enzyme